MAYLQLNSWVHLIGEGGFSLWFFVRDGSAPFCNFRLGFEKDHLIEWGFQVSVCRWAAQQVWPVPQWHSQLHGAASHLQSTSVSAHSALLPMASLRAREWGEEVEEEMVFAFHFFPSAFLVFVAVCLQRCAVPGMEQAEPSGCFMPRW